MKIVSIKKFCNDYYLCFHYKYSKRKLKKYNLWNKKRIIMVRITNHTKAKRIMKCVDTSDYY